MSDKSPDAARSRRLAWTLAALLAVLALVQVAWTVLARADHDWDLDAFLYLGSRLAEGELLYTRDFETKLPLVQYLFYWPHVLGGIGAWKLLNFGLVLALGSLASRRLALAFQDTGRGGGRAQHVTWYLASLYLVTLYSLPGAWSGHLEMIAASLVYLACAWLIAVGRRPIAAHRMPDVAPGFLVGLASLLRPNYVYVAAAMAVWIASGLTGWRIRPVVSRTVAFVAGFGIAVAAAFLPYVVSGPASLAALKDGLHAIGTFSSGMDLEALLEAQFAGPETGWFYGALFLGLALGLVRGVRNLAMGQGGSRVEFDAYLLALLGTSGLIASLLRTHYWVHNSMLFLPFAALLVLVHLHGTFDGVTSRGQGLAARVAGITTWVALTLGVIGAAIYSTGRPMLAAPLQASLSLDINDRNIDWRLMRRLQELRHASISFLAAGYPVYHARLGEPRIGDGHPYMLLRALNGEGLPNIGGLYLYSDEVRAFPCRAVTHSDKQVIVAATNDVFYPWLEKCLAAGRGGYVRLSSPELTPYVFYTRTDARRTVERVIGLR
jgi:hypothetical protein